ncbi:MAG: OmpH family outer membrane protein [Proteobacteria bacterium]|nr:OmpH family outer membrane protein [Pseudomonadota bacterium]
MRLKRSVLSLLVLFVMIGSVSSVYGADVAKIGVVDFQRILKESLAGKDAARILRQKQDERSEDLKKRQQDIVNLQKYIESIELLGEKSDRDQKKLELTIKLDGFKAADDLYSNQLKEINAKQTAEIKDEVFQLIEKIGKKGGYLLILEKNDTLYAPMSTDITSKVVEEYNMDYQRKN